MSFLQKLFSSEKMQDMAFGTLKGYMRENGIQYFLVELQGDEIVPKAYAANDQPVVMPGASMTRIQEIMKEQEQTITGLSERLKVLAEENETLISSVQHAIETPISETMQIPAQVNTEAYMSNLKMITDDSNNSDTQSDATGAQ